MPLDVSKADDMNKHGRWHQTGLRELSENKVMLDGANKAKWGVMWPLNARFFLSIRLAKSAKTNYKRSVGTA